MLHSFFSKISRNADPSAQTQLTRRRSISPPMLFRGFSVDTILRKLGEVFEMIFFSFPFCTVKLRTPSPHASSRIPSALSHSSTHKKFGFFSAFSSPREDDLVFFRHLFCYTVSCYIFEARQTSTTLPLSIFSMELLPSFRIVGGKRVLSGLGSPVSPGRTS